MTSAFVLTGYDPDTRQLIGYDPHTKQNMAMPCAFVDDDGVATLPDGRRVKVCSYDPASSLFHGYDVETKENVTF